MTSESPFLGRAAELALLEEKYDSPRSELVVIYGRRRIGKSRLVQQFAVNKPSLQFEALEGARTPEQLRHFVRSLKRQVQDPLLESFSSRSWDEAFTFLNERVLPQRKGKQIVFLDEFQWMAAGRGKLVSLIKYFWDNHWKKRSVLLILCGSISSFMVDKVVRSNALYGRISLEICLRGLPPREAKLLFQKKRSKDEVLRYLLIFGGVPRYLEEVDLNKSFEQNLSRLCFSPGGFFVGEFERIFYSQFREHQTYLRIVRLLERGILSLDQISRKLRLPSGGGLKRYLRNLEHAEILGCYQPFGRGSNAKDKKYVVVDEYLAFYFKYIAPNLKAIASGLGKNLLSKIAAGSLKSWLGLAFERFCLKHAGALAEAMGFGDQVLDASPYFQRTDEQFQIDLLYRRSDRVITLCEVKYHEAPVETKIIPEVERKCRLLSVPRGYTLERALISVHGQSPSLADTHYFHHSLTLDHIL